MCEHDLCIFITFYFVSSFKLLFLSRVFMMGIIWFTQFYAVQSMNLKYTVCCWIQVPPSEICNLFEEPNMALLIF